MSSVNPFNTQEFLDNYWQQNALLARQALKLPDLIDADELAGLAIEDGIESRLISTEPGTDVWHLKHGPFTEDDFQNLPPSHWTLLVQAVDHWVPEVRSVLKEFQFLPQWRIDDIMISFATDGGGVGPHFDQYDVFLIQLSGKRSWKTGQMCDEDTDLVDQVPVKLLSDFKEEDAWVLEPGDVLYLPPGMAHWGQSIGDSLTLSVGFRAPSDSDIVGELGLFMSTVTSDFQRYQDPQISNRSATPHAILDEDISRVQAVIQRLADDKELLSQWFGRYMTEPKYDDMAVDTGDWNREAFVRHWKKEPLIRNPASRLAYHGSLLFVDGQSISTQFSEQELHRICDSEEQPFSDEKPLQLLMMALLNIGAFVFEA